MNSRKRKKFSETQKVLKSQIIPIRIILYQQNCYNNNLVEATKFLSRELKKLNISLCGWVFFECPICGVYIFSWKKKQKEVTIYLQPNRICVCDFNTCTDVGFDDLQEALYNNLQGNSEFWCKSKKKIFAVENN